MKAYSNKTYNGMFNGSITVLQWDAILFKTSPSRYFVLGTNMELADMQGVKPGNHHIECIVDDFGKLVAV